MSSTNLKSFFERFHFQMGFSNPQHLPVQVQKPPSNLFSQSLLMFVMFQKIYRSKIGQKGPLFAEFFEYAVAYRTSWLKRGFDTPLLNRLIFKKIQRSFGGQLKVCIQIFVSSSMSVYLSAYRSIRLCIFLKNRSNFCW